MRSANCGAASVFKLKRTLHYWGNKYICSNIIRILVKKYQIKNQIHVTVQENESFFFFFVNVARLTKI